MTPSTATYRRGASRETVTRSARSSRSGARWKADKRRELDVRRKPPITDGRSASEAPNSLRAQTADQQAKRRIYFGRKRPISKRSARLTGCQECRRRQDAE